MVDLAVSFPERVKIFQNDNFRGGGGCSKELLMQADK